MVKGEDKRPNTRHKKENPLLHIHAVLLRVPARTQHVLLVVHTQHIVDASSALPGYDACVRVLEGGYTAVLGDLEELRAFETVGAIAEVPEFDFVGDFEGLEGDGYFVWVGALWWFSAM